MSSPSNLVMGNLMVGLSPPSFNRITVEFRFLHKKAPLRIKGKKNQITKNFKNCNAKQLQPKRSIRNNYYSLPNYLKNNYHHYNNLNGHHNNFYRHHKTSTFTGTTKQQQHQLLTHLSPSDLGDPSTNLKSSSFSKRVSPIRATTHSFSLSPARKWMREASVFIRSVREEWWNGYKLTDGVVSCCNICMRCLANSSTNWTDDRWQYTH